MNDERHAFVRGKFEPGTRGGQTPEETCDLCGRDPRNDAHFDPSLDERVFRAVVPDDSRLPRGPHLALCELARAGGPYATVACASCGRARWMHATRHDTCGSHCWVTRYLTEDQIAAVRLVPGIDRELAVSCSRALNDFGLAPGRAWDAKRAVAAAINMMMNRHADRAKATSES